VEGFAGVYRRARGKLHDLVQCDPAAILGGVHIRMVSAGIFG